MKKAFTYLLYGMGLILLIALSISIVIFSQYKRIVDAKPDTKLSVYTPGEFGSKVNPFIGTGGYYYVCAMNFPGITVPFGMVRLSPDTKSFIGEMFS